MTVKKTANTLLVAALLALASVAIAAKGSLGFGTEATFSGFFNPVLKRVKVTTVIPESPAAAAGMKAGDYILEVNGRVINGAPAREMSKQLKDVQVGERLRLKLKRGDVLLDVIIVAGPQKA